MVLQSRPPEYGPGRFHPKAASGHGCITVLLLASVKIGGITKSAVRAKVEHPFQVIKCQWGYRKTRYQGLFKNTGQITVLVCAIEFMDGAACFVESTNGGAGGIGASKMRQSAAKQGENTKNSGAEWADS